MIEYKVRVTGLDKMSDDLEYQALRVTRDRTDRAMSLVVDTIKELLSHQGSGRLYRSTRSEGGVHQASAPGEPPAPDTFALLTSWDHEVNIRGNRIVAIIQSALWHVYARRLELGGVGGFGSYIAPRPYVRPAMAKTDRRVQRILDGDE